MNDSRVFLEIPRVPELLSASQQGLRCILQISPSKWCWNRYWPRGSPGRQAVPLSRQQTHNFTRSHCHLVYANLTLVVLLLWDYRTGDSRPSCLRCSRKAKVSPLAPDKYRNVLPGRLLCALSTTAVLYISRSRYWDSDLHFWFVIERYPFRLLVRISIVVIEGL